MEIGKSLSATGEKKRAQLLNTYKSSSWEFKVNKSELTNLLDNRKCKYKAHLYEETCKRQRLQSTVNNSQIRYRTKLNFSQITTSREDAVLEENKILTKAMVEPKKHPIKPWNDCTRQQKYYRKKVLVHDIEHALDFVKKKVLKHTLLNFKMLIQDKLMFLIQY